MLRGPQACKTPLDNLYFCLILEELQKQLLEQVELRKKLEREFQSLKGKQQQCFTSLHVVSVQTRFYKKKSLNSFNADDQVLQKPLKSTVFILLWISKPLTVEQN